MGLMKEVTVDLVSKDNVELLRYQVDMSGHSPAMIPNTRFAKVEFVGELFSYAFLPSGALFRRYCYGQKGYRLAHAG